MTEEVPLAAERAILGLLGRVEVKRKGIAGVLEAVLAQLTRSSPRNYNIICAWAQERSWPVEPLGGLCSLVGTSPSEEGDFVGFTLSELDNDPPVPAGLRPQPYIELFCYNINWVSLGAKPPEERRKRLLFCASVYSR